MSQSEMVRTAVAVGILFAAYKFIPNQQAKAAALGVLGVVIAKQVPYVQDAI